MMGHRKVVVAANKNTHFCPSHYRVTLNTNDHLTWSGVLSAGISQKDFDVLLKCH